MSTLDVPASRQGWSSPTAWVGRRLPLLAGAAVMAGDALLVVGAFLLAYWVRFIVPDLEAAALGLDEYVRLGALVSLVAVVLFALHEFYDLDRPRSWLTRFQMIVSTVSTALVLTVAMSFFLGDLRFSRLWFAAGWAFSVIGLVGWRWLAVSGYAAARDAVVPARKVLIVGANVAGRDLARELATSCQVVGYVDNGSDLEDAEAHELSLIGPIASLDRLVQQYGVDEIVVALPPSRREQLGRIVARGFGRPVQVKFAADLGEPLPERFALHRHGGRSFIGFAPVAPVSWLKRAFDLVFGTLAVIGLAPVMAAIAILIRLDSPGPIFYGQERVGKDGVRFTMLKFRSMRQDADRLLEELRAQNEASGPLFKMRNDPRVTKIGRVLRRTSLDELPQLFNVLLGQMSLVGPRPPVPSEVAQYEDWQFGRLRAVPGMTGLWQVSGRSDVPFHDMVRLDLHYIRNWSLWWDLEIILRTIPAVIGKSGAY
ncbi:MAG: sugar transferase [Chloroflexi bacterium]|nr:sugar transferase [Chloroflexota bacterium]